MNTPPTRRELIEEAAWQAWEARRNGGGDVNDVNNVRQSFRDGAARSGLCDDEETVRRDFAPILAQAKAWIQRQKRANENNDDAS